MPPKEGDAVFLLLLMRTYVSFLLDKVQIHLSTLVDDRTAPPVHRLYGK